MLTASDYITIRKLQTVLNPYVNNFKCNSKNKRLLHIIVYQISKTPSLKTGTLNVSLESSFRADPKGY